MLEREKVERGVKGRGREGVGERGEGCEYKGK